MRSPMRLMLLSALAVALGGCGAGRGSGAAEDPVTTVRVENRGWTDMTIYVLPSAQRIRLGLATANSTTVLRLPRNLVFGATQLRFLADPIGGSRTPISENITVTPGDEVTLLIAP